MGGDGEEAEGRQVAMAARRAHAEATRLLRGVLTAKTKASTQAAVDVLLREAVESREEQTRLELVVEQLEGERDDAVTVTADVARKASELLSPTTYKREIAKLEAKLQSQQEEADTHKASYRASQLALEKCRHQLALAQKPAALPLASPPPLQPQLEPQPQPPPQPPPVRAPAQAVKQQDVAVAAEMESRQWQHELVQMAQLVSELRAEVGAARQAHARAQVGCCHNRMVQLFPIHATPV